MNVVIRTVPGHFCDVLKCHHFLHADITVGTTEEEAREYTKYCISLIGEYGSPDEWKWLNSTQKTYEIMVFDRNSDNPWAEIDRYLTNSKLDAITKFRELVNKYLELANADS